MTAPTTLDVAGPPGVVTLLPTLLGFHPRDSLVVVTLDGDPPVLGLTARADLPPPGDDVRERETIAQVVRVLTARGTTAALLAVVGGPGPGSACAVLAPLRAALAAAGVHVAHAVWAASTAAGAPWHDVDDPRRRGSLGDPAATTLAAIAAYEGDVTFPDRAGLARLVAPADAAALTLRAALLDAEIDAMAGRVPDVAAEVTAVRAAVAAAARGELPCDDAAIVRLALAIEDGDVRDRCLALCVGEEAEAAERLWLALTRATPGPEVAGPAALAALCAYLRGDGALANVALDRALAAAPEHTLATLLAGAVSHAVRPETLRTLVHDAIADAAVSDAELSDAALLDGESDSGPDAELLDGEPDSGPGAAPLDGEPDSGPDAALSDADGAGRP